jgi:hypothetical protein
MDHYTPRYSKGFTGYDYAQKDSLRLFTTELIFSPSDDNGYQTASWDEISLITGEVTNQGTYLPPCGQIVFWGSSDTSFLNDKWDGSAEVVLCNSASSASNGSQDELMAAWMWGDGFDENDEFTPLVSTKKFLMSCSGSLLGQPFVRVRTGISSAASADSEVRLSAFVTNQNMSVSDRINPVCTVPPFDSANGEYFRSRTGGTPARQPAQCQRHFITNPLTASSLGTSATRTSKIFGGPWLGQITAVGASGPVQLDSYGDGVLIETAATQARLAEPSMFGENRFDVTNTHTGSQQVDYRIGLYSPTR